MIGTGEQITAESTVSLHLCVLRPSMTKIKEHTHIYIHILYTYVYASINMYKQYRHIIYVHSDADPEIVAIEDPFLHRFNKRFARRPRGPGTSSQNSWHVNSGC
jgi:hypothetical protein